MGSLRGNGSPLITIAYRHHATTKAICLSLCLFCGVSDLHLLIRAELTQCSMGAALFGYDLGVIAYVIAAPDFLRTVDMATDLTYNADYMGFIVSSLLLG
jgi:hypothetical protein